MICLGILRNSQEFHTNSYEFPSNSYEFSGIPRNFRAGTVGTDGRDLRGMVTQAHHEKKLRKMLRKSFVFAMLSYVFLCFC